MTLCNALVVAEWCGGKDTPSCPKTETHDLGGGGDPDRQQKVDQIPKNNSKGTLSSRGRALLYSVPVISKRNRTDGTHKINHLNTKGKKFPSRLRPPTCPTGKSNM